MRAVMSLSDRIVVLNLGAKLAEGSPQEVADNPDVIAAYLGDFSVAQRSGEAGVTDTLLQVEALEAGYGGCAGALGHLAQGQARQHDHAAWCQRRRQNHQPACDHRGHAPARRQGGICRRGRDLAARPRQGGTRPRAGTGGAAAVQQHDRGREFGNGGLFAPRPPLLHYPARAGLRHVPAA